MNIIVTKHAQQRRPEYDIIPKQDIIDIMEYFVNFFNITLFTKNGSYKIHAKNICLVFNKEKDDLTVITMRGIKHLNDINTDIKFKLNAQDNNPKFIYVQRINFKGLTKKCGKLIKWANCWELQIKKKTLDKFILPRYNLKTDNPEDNVLLYKDKFGRFFLKDFPRK